MAEMVRSCLEVHRAKSLLADIGENAKSQSSANNKPKNSLRDQMRIAKAKMMAANKNNSDPSGEDSCLVVIA